jgi:quercetin dioxygenase-like cupin family protein
MGSSRKPAAAEPVLPPDIEAALAVALNPVEPAAPRAAAIRARLLDRVHRDGRRFVTVRTAEGEWVPLAPDIAVKVLDDDGAMQSFLLRLDPGARLPAHDHPDDEVCVILEGTVRLGDVEVSAGDYHMAPAGSRHGELFSATGAVLFIRTRSGTIPHRRAR